MFIFTILYPPLIFSHSSRLLSSLSFSSHFMHMHNFLFLSLDHFCWCRVPARNLIDCNRVYYLGTWFLLLLLISTVLACFSRNWKCSLLCSIAVYLNVEDYSWVNFIMQWHPWLKWRGLERWWKMQSYVSFLAVSGCFPNLFACPILRKVALNLTSLRGGGEGSV